VVAAIARNLSQYGIALEPGMLIMTGSITSPLELPAGALSARAMFTTLGSVGLQFL
jgi:2-keto-4-pentenoate hydratase